jgi:general secretion pathway protein K
MLARNQGYILLATLGVIVVLTVMVGFFAVRLDMMRENTRQLRAVADARIAEANAFAEIMLRMVTLPRSENGFGVDSDRMVTDGRPYRIGPTIARVQDARGLVNLNLSEPNLIWRLFVLQGIGPADADRLVDTLEDYIDTDSAVRLNGAEASAYEAAGMPPPPNDWLISTGELGHIAGWSDLLRSRPELLRLFTVARDGFVNPNTAGRELLQALPGATKEGVARFLDLRKTQQVHSTSELAAVTGIAPGTDLIRFLPGDYFRVETIPVGAGPETEYTVLLTLADDNKPWRLLEIRFAADSSRRAPDDDPVVPLAELAVDASGASFAGGIADARR